MSDKLKKSSVWKTPAKKALDRPFNPKVLRHARELANKYRILLEPDDELGFMGRAVEMPFVFGDGKTPDSCVEQTRHALIAAIATLLEMNQTPPLPAAENRRVAQINLRVTAEEKLLLEEAARRKGFRGVSDYVRSTSLAEAR
jgi:predicted RNase H-like HicB family nuclease